jgi:hypothetical protein
MSKQFSQKLAAFYYSLVTFLKTDLGIAICLTLAWQIILTAIGYIVDTKLHLPTTGLFADMPEGILGHTLRWDSGWYMEIIRSDFYQHTSSQGAVFAFYPLYPLLVALATNVSFGLISLQAASLAITTIATIAALTALIKISSHLLADRQSSILVALLFILSPAAMFLHVFYSEAVFIAIGSWAYLFALKRRWAYMAILLAILSLARLPAILFIALCGLEFLRAYQWNIKKSVFNRSFLWFFITPLGFVVYSIWCYVVSGDPLAMFHAYKASDGWPYQVFDPNIIHTVAQAGWTLVADIHNHGLNKGIVVNGILPLGSLFILFITAMYAIFIAKGPFIPLGIFNLLAIVFFTLNSNVTSIHRYSLACISIFIITVFFFMQYKKLSWILYLGIVGCFVLQIGLLTLFITGHFAG